MSDLRYEISVAVQNALRNLDQISNKIEKVNQDFEKITDGIGKFGAAATAALTAAGAAALRFADEVADVAAANETTISTILALQGALQGAGGNAENTGRMLQTLSNNIEAANGGNLKLVDTFGKLGISVKDLGSLSQDQIRDKLLASLSEIKDPAERNAKAMDLFGKSMLGVNIPEFVKNLQEQKGQYAENEAAIQTAADAFDTLGEIYKKLKIAAAEAFEPLFKFIKNLKVDVADLTVVFRLLAAATAAAVSVSVLAGFAKLVTVLKELNTVVSKNKLITIIGAILAVGTAAATWIGLNKDIEEGQKDINNEIEQTSEKTNQVKRDQSGLNDLIQKQKDSLSQVTEQFDRQLKLIQDKLGLERDTLSLSEEQKRVKQEQSNIEQQAQNALMSLKQKYDALDANSRAARKSDYEKEQDLINRNAEAAKKDVENRIQGIERYRASLKDLQSQITIYSDMATKKFEQEARAQGDLGTLSDRIELEGKLNAITKTREILLNSVNKVSEDQKAAAIAAISTETNNLKLLQENYGGINQAIEQNIQKLVEQGQISRETAKILLTDTANARLQAVVSADELTQSNKKLSDQSRTFASGWNKAFNEYVDNAQNAAQQARNIFQKLTQGLEDLFVNFVKTGKFEWKNFVNMMVEELLRSQIRQLMGNIFNVSGMGNIGGGGGGLLGGKIIPGILADGGPVSANRPYIVGERGPELFMPDSGGKMIPNRDLGGSVVNYNINAVDAASFKAMIARDPSFIHAVAMQGAKSVPVRR